jgi:CheY-like chemotaxis protein
MQPGVDDDSRDSVLVLDDRAEVTDSAASYFESRGVSVVTASNPREGWERLRTDGQRLRCGIIDKNLELDETAGFDFVQQAQQQYPGIAFVVFTAWNLSEQDRERMSAGNVVVLDKGQLRGEDLFEIFRGSARNAKAALLLSAETNHEAGDVQGPRAALLPPAETSREAGVRARDGLLIERLMTEKLRKALRTVASELVAQLRSDEFSAEDVGILLDDRHISLEELISEIEESTPLGIRLLEVHGLIVRDLLGPRPRRRK